MIRRIVILGLLLLSPCLAADPPKDTDQIDPLLLAAVDAAMRGDLKPLSAEVDAKARVAIADPAKLDPSLVQLATLREFSTYFGRLDAISNPNRRLMAWLIAQPKVASPLMMAVSAEDPPDGLLEVLRRLNDDHGDGIARSPDLLAAFCTVWDSTGDVNEDAKKVDLDRVARLYNYYTRSSPRFDLKDLPWQLSTWVVSNPLSEDEIAFARDKYQDRKSPADIFFDPPYSEYPGYVREPKNPNDLLYTLPNILKHGGTTVDQARYATSVCRSIGVPAAVCTATLDGDDQSHAPAWAAVLEVSNRRMRWNLYTARYPEHLGWRGRVTDPQTHLQLSDSELHQLAELQAVSLDQRLQSMAICNLLPLADEAKQPELLLKAIELSPGNLRAWQAINTLAGKRKLSAGQEEAYVAAIEKLAVPRNGAFALEMYLPIVRPRGTLQQIPLLDAAAKWFTNQPDVLARVRLEQGHAQVKLKRPDLALDAFKEAANLQPRCSPMVLEAFQRIDALYRDNNSLPQLIDLYAIAWPRLDRPRPTPYSRTVPYVLIGRMYVQALEDAGNKVEAIKIRTMIDSVHLDRD